MHEHRFRTTRGPAGATGSVAAAQRRRPFVAMIAAAVVTLLVSAWTSGFSPAAAATTAPTITTTSLASGTVGATYYVKLAATGGTTPYTWSGTGLPAGLQLGTGGGLSGTPTTAGTSTVAVTLTDAAGQTATATLSVKINAALAVTTASLPAGTIGTAYSAKLAASGGTGTLTWSVTAGTLPAGLTLAGNGQLTGTPTAAARSTVTVQVKDAVAAKATASLTITVTAASGPSITTSSLPAGTAGAPYSQTLAASGGTPPYQWTATGLASELALTPGGVLSGTPVAAGTSSIAVSVTDAAGAGAGATLPLTVNPAAAAGLIAHWLLNEPAGATTMADSGPNGLTGQIGTGVQTGVAIGSSVGYRFTPSATPSDAGLVSVPYSAKYDPMSQNVRITLQVATTQTTEANFIQNGEAGTAGGFYKVEMTGGKAGCYFSGSIRQREAWSTVKINDGQVHTITCYKTDTFVQVLVDGANSVKAWDDTGSVYNYKAMSIGGKSACTTTTAGLPNCDYFDGVLSDIQIVFTAESAS